MINPPPPAYNPSENNMGYSFAQPPASSYGNQQQMQASYPPQQQQQQQLVPHYGPGPTYSNGHDPNAFQQNGYQNYQVPYNPEYVSYASSTVAASPTQNQNNPPDLLESAASSYESNGHLKTTSNTNTVDDVMAVFESTATATPVTTSTTPKTAPQDEAFLRSFTAEEIAEQERLMQDIERRNSSSMVAASTPTSSAMTAPAAAAEMTVHQQQEKLWNSIHQEHPAGRSTTTGSNNGSVVPHYSQSAPNTMTVYNENKLIEVPRSHNPSGSDAVHPRRKEMKQARKVKQATAATGGAIVGGVLFGPAWPLGVVAGGAVGAVAGKQISKAGERRAQRKWEKQNFQHYASSESAVAKGEHDLL